MTFQPSVYKANEVESTEMHPRSEALGDMKGIACLPRGLEQNETNLNELLLLNICIRNGHPCAP
jgi:hypothetical protein